MLNFCVCFVELLHFAQFLLTSATEKEKTLRSPHSLYSLRICTYTHTNGIIYIHESGPIGTYSPITRLPEESFKIPYYILVDNSFKKKFHPKRTRSLFLNSCEWVRVRGFLKTGKRAIPVGESEAKSRNKIKGTVYGDSSLSKATAKN